MNAIWETTISLRRFVHVMALVFVFAALAYGQTSFGRISGTVTDASGAAVPGSGSAEAWLEELCTCPITQARSAHAMAACCPVPASAF